jgi:hypothetical protein
VAHEEVEAALEDVVEEVFAVVAEAAVDSVGEAEVEAAFVVVAEEVVVDEEDEVNFMRNCNYLNNLHQSIDLLGKHSL